MGGKKLIFIGAAVGAVLAGAVAFAFIAGPFAQSPGVAEAKAVETPVVGREFGPMFQTKERVVNLADRDSRRYLKFEMALELAMEDSGAPLKGEALKKKQTEMIGELTSISPAIDDAITSILSSKTAADVVTPQGKVLLREELQKALGDLVAPKQITKVYFTQFIIQ
jgi:flagellar protein FliL